MSGKSRIDPDVASGSSADGRAGEPDADARSAEIEIVRDAQEAGYFEVPRRTSLVDLARAHDISDVEASRRLRRGIERFLEDSE